MKRLFFLILVFLVFSNNLEAQNLYPEPGKHSVEWWANVDHYPAYPFIYNDTLTSTVTTDWVPLYKWGSGIFRFAFVVDTVDSIWGADTVNVTATTNSGFYTSFELLMDSADTRVGFTNYDDSEIVIASGSALTTTPPFAKVYPLKIYMGRWIRFTLTVADTCSLTVYRGDHR